MVVVYAVIVAIVLFAAGFDWWARRRGDRRASLAYWETMRRDRRQAAARQRERRRRERGAEQGERGEAAEG